MHEVQELFNAGLLSKSECDRRLADVSQCHAQQAKQAKHAHAHAHGHPERQWQSMPDVTMVTAGAATRSQNKADMIALLDLETREQVCRKSPVCQSCCTQKRTDRDSTDILTLTMSQARRDGSFRSTGSTRHIHTSNYHRPSMRMAASHDQSHYAHNFVRGKGKDKTFRRHSGLCGGGSHNF